MDKCPVCGMAFVGGKELSEHYTAAHEGHMIQCQSCGRLFEREEFEKHMPVHSVSDDLSKHVPVEEAESRLLRRAGEEEQARKRTRGPYRKSHAA